MGLIFTLQKDERLEYLRVFSCFFVVLGHISNWYMRKYPKLPMDSYVCAVLFNGICRVSVPIFFMISGALLLEQQIDYKKNTKRTLSIFLKTAIWTVVFIVWDYFYLGDVYEMKNILSIPVRVHFWFMYVMIGIYITVPLWQKLVSGDSKKLMKYFSFVFIGLMAINFVLTMLQIKATYKVPLLDTSCYAGYFIMGYVIRHYIDEIKIKKWVCVVVLAACVGITDFLTFYYTKKLGEHDETFSDFRTVFIGVAAMLVFYCVMKMKNLKHHAWISVISKHSFNIYMMHVFFLDIIQVNIDITKFTAWLGFPVFFVFLISLSFGFSWLYEKAKGKHTSMI